MERNRILIEPRALLERLSQGGPADRPGNLRIFDASVQFGKTDATGQAEYLTGHLPGAAFFDHFKMADKTSKHLLTVPDEPTLSHAIGNIGIANQHDVIVYATGDIMWATRAWWLLRYAGHDRVRILNGDLNTWQQAGGELESGECHYQPARFTSNLRPAMFASKDEVIDAMTNEALCTVNTLPHDLYTGDTDVPYAREGHITGSLSHPWEDLLDGASFAPDKILAARLEQRLAPGKKVITYCGGGIAATVNAVACLLAGMDDVAVYDGSMMEWLAAELPTTRGDLAG